MPANGIEVTEDYQSSQDHEGDQWFETTVVDQHPAWSISDIMNGFTLKCLSKLCVAFTPLFRLSFVIFALPGSVGLWACVRTRTQPLRLCAHA